jgi:hypothetical protein
MGLQLLDELSLRRQSNCLGFLSSCLKLRKGMEQSRLSVTYGVRQQT